MQQLLPLVVLVLVAGCVSFSSAAKPVYRGVATNAWSGGCADLEVRLNQISILPTETERFDHNGTMTFLNSVTQILIFFFLKGIKPHLVVLELWSHAIIERCKLQLRPLCRICSPSMGTNRCSIWCGSTNPRRHYTHHWL